MSSTLRLGKVSRARGLRGEVLVKAYNNDTEALTPGQTLTATAKDGSKRELLVRRASRTAKGWVVAFDGVADRNAAERLQGAELLLEWSDLPDLGEDEFYYEQLRGFEVVRADGTRLGEIAGMYESYADMLVIRDGSHELYLPVLDGFVKEIDSEGKRVVVDPPEGLLDIL